MIKSGNIKPRRIMLIDGIGAVISTLLLGVVLVRLEEYIGMPSDVLYPLAGAALVFALYSYSCYLFVPTIHAMHIRIIGYANLAYCLMTGYLVVDLFDQLTMMGILYFIMEMMLILCLVMVEMRVAAKLNNDLK